MSAKIVFLEEDRDDWSLVRETLAELNMDVPVQFFSSSTDLFEFLQNAPAPSLIMVDYNAVPDNGLEVLKQLREVQEWKDIPVVILSDSNDAFYRKECYRYGASSFIRKPDTLKDTRNKIGIFFKYWLDVAEV